MKNLLYTLIFTLICAAGVAQIGYKPMNGYYEFNGNLRFADTMFVDTAALDVTSGVQISLDTVGSSTSGYYRIIASAGGGGIIGSGANTQLAIFGSSDSLFSSGSVTFNSVTNTLNVGSGAISAPLSVVSSTGGGVTVDKLTLQNQAAEERLVTTDGNGISIYVNGLERLALDTGATKFNQGATKDILVYNGADTVFSISADSSFVGIKRGNPEHPLDIDANSNIFLKVTDPARSKGGSIATFTNAPQAGNPITYVRVKISEGGSTVDGVIPILPIP
jgi:hypothetical protein